MSDFKAKVHQIQFPQTALGLGAYSDPPVTLAGFKGPLRGREGNGKGWGKGRGEGWGRRRRGGEERRERKGRDGGGKGER